jgi:hypothetical protein
VSGQRFAVGAMLLAMALAAVGVALAAKGLPEPDRDPGVALVGLPSPAPTAEGRPSIRELPSGAPADTPSPRMIGTGPDDAAADPPDLPRFPGSALVSHEQDTDGAVSWVLVEYIAAQTDRDDVREHYRQVFRDAGWFVGDVDFRDGVWTFTANQGPREARLEIAADGTAVRTVAFVSDEAAGGTEPPDAASDDADAATNDADAGDDDD